MRTVVWSGPVRSGSVHVSLVEFGLKSSIWLALGGVHLLLLGGRCCVISYGQLRPVALRCTHAQRAISFNLDCVRRIELYA